MIELEETRTEHHLDALSLQKRACEGKLTCPDLHPHCSSPPIDHQASIDGMKHAF
jgi:hypothetical protein